MRQRRRENLINLLMQGTVAFNTWRFENPKEDVELSGADLSELDLDAVLLAGADLSSVDFSGASLKAAVFSGANLAGVNFTGADLTGANFGYHEFIDGRIAFTPLGKRLVHRAEVPGAVSSAPSCRTHRSASATSTASTSGFATSRHSTCAVAPSTAR